MELGNDDLVDVLEVDAAGKALLRTEKDAVAALTERFAELAALGEGRGTACYDEQRTVGQILPDRRSVLVQRLDVSQTDHDALAVPLRRHLHRRHDLDRRIAGVLAQRVRRGADAEHQRDLLHQLEHGVLPMVPRGNEILPLELVKFLYHGLIHLKLFIGERERHLMDAPNVLAADLFKRPRDNSLAKDLVENVGVVDVLRALADAEHGRLLGQVAAGKQPVARLIRRDRLSVVRVRTAPHRVVVPVVVVDHPAPRRHVDRVVVEQFQLRRELGDVVARARSGRQQLIMAAAEARKRGLCACAVRVRDLVALVKDQLRLLAVYPHPAFDLPPELTHLIERHNDEIAALDAVQVRDPLHEHIRQAVVLQNDVPVVAD